jgi:hypothetical protein
MKVSPDPKIYDLIDTSQPHVVFDEVRYLLEQTAAPVDLVMLESVFTDTIRLFEGDYPGYRASRTYYHDLEHTNSVFLALARLLHGGNVQGHTFESQNVFLALAAALFHDVGFILTEEDEDSSGAQFTIGHEARSIVFMRKYLSRYAITPGAAMDCNHLIQCTVLNLPVEEIPFRSKEIRMLGKMVGTADLEAQMADRLYLEKLPLLYKEFAEAGIPEYVSELDLFQKTEKFYKHVVQKRLVNQFCNIALWMRFHFKERWGIDRDLYTEAIEKNIEYLKRILKSGGTGSDGYRRFLRRGGATVSAEAT